MVTTRIGAAIEIIPINSKNVEEITIMKGTLTCSFSALLRICNFLKELYRYAFQNMQETDDWFYNKRY